MQNRQWVVLLAWEALGEKMAENVQKKECQTTGWEMDQSKLFSEDSQLRMPGKKKFKK